MLHIFLFAYGSHVSLPHRLVSERSIPVVTEVLGCSNTVYSYPYLDRNLEKSDHCNGLQDEEVEAVLG